MDVKLLEATDDPEDLICKAARNDYSDTSVGSQSFEATMAEVDGDSLEEKKETLIGHLLDHGHFGPFEHAQATSPSKAFPAPDGPDHPSRHVAGVCSRCRTSPSTTWTPKPSARGNWS